MTEYYLPPDPPAGMPAFDGVVRDDGAWIPADPANRDFADYETWRAAGNDPLPYPPEGVPPPAAEPPAAPKE